MMKTSLRFMLMVPLAAAGLGACSSNPEVSIGDPVGAALTDYAASWDGYAEAYQFPDQSDRIRLVVDGSGVGTLQLGDSPALPPPTDPSVGYPTDLNWDKKGGSLWIIPDVVTGFGYPLYDTRVEDSRIRLDINPYDVWAGWCALQQPIADSRGYYGCVPDFATVSANGDVCTATSRDSQETFPIDCGKLNLCSTNQVCACTGSGCVSTHPAPPLPIQLDAALSADGTQLTGTLLMGSQQRITIRMHR
jgi:hypothetical protein